MNRRQLLVAAGTAVAATAVGIRPAAAATPGCLTLAAVHAASLYRAGAGSHLCHLFVPPNPNGRLVIHHHGTGQDDEAMVTDPLLRPVTVALLDAGFAVASSNAHGTNWGNDKALDDYAQLYDWVTSIIGAPVSVSLVAGSMGGISALLCIAQARIPNVTHFAGIYPACNLAACFTVSSLRSAINAAYGGAAAYPAASVGHDPMLYDPAVYAGVRFRCWASPGDTTVKKVDNADAFTALVAPVATEATVVTCSGNHGDPSHFDPGALVAFLGT